MAKDVIRAIWCTRCNSPQNHSIIYRGTVKKDNQYLAVFDSVCLICAEKAEKRIIPKLERVHSEIPIPDYNALIKCELYG